VSGLAILTPSMAAYDAAAGTFGQLSLEEEVQEKRDLKDYIAGDESSPTDTIHGHDRVPGNGLSHPLTTIDGDNRDIDYQVNTLQSILDDLDIFIPAAFQGMKSTQDNLSKLRFTHFRNRIASDLKEATKVYDTRRLAS